MSTLWHHNQRASGPCNACVLLVHLHLPLGSKISDFSVEKFHIPKISQRTGEQVAWPNGMMSTLWHNGWRACDPYNAYALLVHLYLSVGLRNFRLCRWKCPPHWGRQPDFCNGQVSQSLDPTERWARFGIVGTMLVVYTMLVRSLCTCICPSVSINSDFSVENCPLGWKLGELLCGNRWQFF